MLLTKEVQIKVCPQTVNHYLSLGYEIPMKKASESYRKIYHKEYVYDFSVPITVDVKDLTKGCKVDVDVLCDYCQEEIMTMKYATYSKTTEHLNKNSCKKCKGRKEEEYFLMKYGVRMPSQLDEFKEKYRTTCIERFGTDNYFKTKEFDVKRKESMNEKYGVEYPLQSKEIQERWKYTCMDKYGVNNPAKAQETKDKAAITNMKRYGGVAPAKSSDVRKKMSETLYINGTVSTSKQQFYLFNLYKTTDTTIQLNYPISRFNADICLLNEKIDIEYDGGFHDGRVKLGQLTQEEFNRKEIIRNNIIKREGYKQIKIVSSKDLLPSDPILLQMLSEAKQYFSLYPNHSWIEFSIDTLTVRNAEHKDGIPYSFGELRKIKDSDLPNNNNINLKGA